MYTITIETKEYESGHKLEIKQELYAENPRKSWDMLGTLTMFTREYEGDEYIPYNDYAEFLEETEDIYFSLPVYFYDLRSNGARIHTCKPYDANGVIWISKAEAKKEYNWKNRTKKRLEKLERIFKAELDVLDSYFQGDVFGFVLEDSAGDIVESVWGFYGMDEIKHIIKECDDIVASDIEDNKEFNVCFPMVFV